MSVSDTKSTQNRGDFDPPLYTISILWYNNTFCDQNDPYMFTEYCPAPCTNIPTSSYDSDTHLVSFTMKQRPVTTSEFEVVVTIDDSSYSFDHTETGYLTCFVESDGFSRGLRFISQFTKDEKKQTFADY